MSRRFDERSSFGPTLEWEALPVLGEDRQRRFARKRIRRAGLAIAGFWTALLILAAWPGS